MDIAIVGAGNVAWHLAQALQAAGHKVVAIYSRTQKHSEELTQLLPQATPTLSLDFNNTPAELILVAIPDAALFGAAQAIRVKAGTIVAHTSGSVPLDVLQSIAGAQIGVFYPLQTFTKYKPVQLDQVPLLIEAQDQQTLTQLQALAQSISNQVLEVNSLARKQLHVAAVFACNFTNHLLGISQELLQKAQLPEQLLQPLIQETIAKAAERNPFTVQTGPAVRNDFNVIDEHLRMLEQHPSYQQLYKILTQSIQEKQAQQQNL